MVFDRSENEPEEWDPEEELYDPESDGLTIPQVSTGDESGDDDGLGDLADTPDISTVETDVPADLHQTFWVLVLVINAAVAAVSLGLMFLVFEGAVTRSAVLLVAGFVLFGLAGRRYRRFDDDDSAASSGTDTDAGSGADAESAESAESAGSTSTDAAETTSGDAPQQRSPTQNDSP